jgi:ABC-type uncharacterized transport system involved in gliding motility auxiliary subunit
MYQSIVTFLATGGFWVGGLGLAAFLSLFWVLRGAPIGQAVAAEEDEDAPRGGYRDRVVAAVCLGMLLILAGAYLAFTRGVGWSSAAAFALGFGTVLTLVMINRKHRHGSPTLRRTVDVSTAALNAALVAGVLVVVNVIAFRYGGRAIDMTNERTYSLAPRSLNQVRTLQRPVTFTSFFGRGPLAAQQYDRVQELLELYKAANPDMVRVENVDPFRDQARYEALVERVPGVAVDVNQGGGVVIELGEGKTADRLVIRNVDLFEMPRASRFNPDVQGYELRFKGEDAVTTALMRLREAKKPKVVFTAFHGEAPVDNMEVDRRGQGFWKNRLTETGAEVVTVNLLTDEIPVDAALVVVGGPDGKKPFQPEEVAKLKAASDRKVPLLVLVGDAQTTGLEDFLKGFNVSVEPGYVFEPRMNVPRERLTAVVPVVNPNHPVLDSLDNTYAAFLKPAPLKIVASTRPDAPGAHVLTTSLLKTSRESWVETDLATLNPKRDPTDPPGPVDVAIAVTDRPAPGDTRPPNPRLVVFSSRYLADNHYAQLNLDLLMNAVNWLRGRAESTGSAIPAKVHDMKILTADPVLRARLILVPTVMAVLLILTLGLTTYLARRA